MKATPQQKIIAKRNKFENNGMHFNRYFLKHRIGSKMIIGQHHPIVQQALDRTMLEPEHNDFISRLIINVPPGYTKCSVSGTMVSTINGYIPIDDLSGGVYINSFNNGVLVYRELLGKDSYLKDCVEIKLLSGRALKVSNDHPVLTQSGWIKAIDLTDSHYLIRVCSEIDDGGWIREEILDFITLMLFEGGCSNPRTPRFTSSDKEIVDILYNCGENLGFEIVKYKTNRKYDYNIKGGSNSAAVKLLSEYGINGHLATKKRLPVQFFNLPLMQKYRFISLMVATDGFITKNHGNIGVTLANKELINDIALLLDTCGIPSSQYEQRNDTAGAFTLMISPEHSKQLLGKVDFLQKQEKFEACCKMRPKNGSLIFGYPQYITKGLTEKCKKVRPRISLKYNKPITEYLFNRIKNEIDSSVDRFRMDDFIYDRVKEIKSIGEKKVFHLSVKSETYDGKNYIANGLVVHNTEMAAIHYMARGLAKDKRNRFLHLSYSDSLALQNSSFTREIVKSPEYQAMWPIQTKDDSDSKSIWWTTEGGGCRATSAAGQVTGFRAGHMEKDRFTGALIIDDPVKPDDAYSEVVRESINNRYNETIASRVAVETVPIIVIMQRIHYSDLAGYLLRGGSGEKWHHLNLPVIIDNSVPYPEENTHGIEIKHNLPDGWLWPYKHNEEHRVALESHRRKWLSQYMQKPPKRNEEQMIWTEPMIKKAHGNKFDTPQRTLVAIDPAASNTKTSDEHGIVVGSKHGKDKYSVDADFSRKGTPKHWADTAIYFYDEYSADAIVIETNQGGDMATDTLRNAGFRGKIIEVKASKGKVARAEPIAALYEQDFVRHGPGLSKLENEMLDFDPVTGLSNGKSPNRVDAAVWLLTALSKKGEFFVG